MLMDFLTNFQPIQFFIIATAIIVLFNYDKHKRSHNILLCIVLTSLINEILTTLLIINSIDYALVFNVCNTIHTMLWLSLLYYNLGFNTVYKTLTLLYCICAVASFILVINDYKVVNMQIFLIGAFLYLFIFVSWIIKSLKKEDFTIFLSNNIILLCAPVLFFSGFSFILSFQNGELADRILIGRLNLYQVIGYIINFIYYTLINIYIYREKRLKYA